MRSRTGAASQTVLSSVVVSTTENAGSEAIVQLWHVSPEKFAWSGACWWGGAQIATGWEVCALARQQV